MQKKLFTPVQIGPITLKHRVVMPPLSRLRGTRVHRLPHLWGTWIKTGYFCL